MRYDGTMKKLESERPAKTIHLRADASQTIEVLIASGAYHSAEEVVYAGLNALQEQTEALDHWLATEVAPVYDAMQADPDRARTAAQVAERLQDNHAARQRREVRGL